MCFVITKFSDLLYVRPLSDSTLISVCTSHRNVKCPMIQRNQILFGRRTRKYHNQIMNNAKYSAVDDKKNLKEILV